MSKNRAESVGRQGNHGARSGQQQRSTMNSFRYEAKRKGIAGFTPNLLSPPASAEQRGASGCSPAREVARGNGLASAAGVAKTELFCTRVVFLHCHKRKNNSPRCSTAPFLHRARSHSHPTKRVMPVSIDVFGGLHLTIFFHQFPVCQHERGNLRWSRGQPAAPPMPRAHVCRALLGSPRAQLVADSLHTSPWTGNTSALQRYRRGISPQRSPREMVSSGQTHKPLIKKNLYNEELSCPVQTRRAWRFPHSAHLAGRYGGASHISAGARQCGQGEMSTIYTGILSLPR